MLTGVYKPDGRPDHASSAHDVTGKPPHAITQLGVGRTFQNIRLFQHMTAVENVLVGMHARLRGGILGSVFGTPRVRREEREARERARRAAALLRACGAATTSSRATSPTATSAGSRSRARSPPTRSCSSSTSRRPA